jgi:oxygen-independent coproporphyrinogen-3 oxidase
MADRPHESVVPADPRPDIGLYVHVPFCTSKCGYCDFYSHVGRPGTMEPLVDALLREFERTVPPSKARIQTVFVGGGTPTVLPVELLDRLLRPIGELARRDGCIEFTVEANPATVDDRKAALLRDCGVDRVSMGAQSFDPGELKILEREHRPQDVPASVEVLRRAGLDRYNIDLIFGVPGQTLESWLASLRAAIELEPEHLSCYGLTYEPGTRMHRRLNLGRVVQADEDVEAEMFLVTADTLAAAGYRQYEISNYARPGRECRHNLRYWHNRPGIGLGPSAASYDGRRRWRNLPDTAEYVRRIERGLSPVIDEEELSPRERAGETAMLNLRLEEGVRRGPFRARTGFDPFELFREVIGPHAAAGRLCVSDGGFALTREGRLVANAVISDFLSPRERPR